MNAKTMKLAGIVISILGIVVNMASDWLGEKKLDAKIAEKVEAKLAEHTAE